MALNKTSEEMRSLLGSISTDLEKASRGNKAAAQRVRVNTVKLEKVAKNYRKESVADERLPSKRKKKQAGQQKKAADKKAAAAKKAAPKKKAAGKSASSSKSSTQKKTASKARPLALRRPTAKLPMKRTALR